MTDKQKISKGLTDEQLIKKYESGTINLSVALKKTINASNNSKIEKKDKKE